jgi:hypothetical protein
MAILTIENDIKSQLESAITDLKVDTFPEAGEYKLLHPKGAVLVAYESSSFNPPDSIAIIQQLVNHTFTITLIIKGLRDKNGAYSYIDLIISTLAGYEPTDCLKMYPQRTRFFGEESGIYRYDIDFIVPTENYE